MKRFVAGIIAAAVLLSTAQTAMAQAKTISSEMRTETGTVEAIEAATSTPTAWKRSCESTSLDFPSTRDQLLRADSDDPLLHPDFRTRYGIAGVTVGILPNMYAYAEARLFDDSVSAQGEEGFDVLAIGVHYGFTLKGFHRR
jgi:hypothetical protein